MVTGRGEGSCDAQLFVAPPRTLASLTTAAGACSHHNEKAARQGHDLATAE